MEIKDKKPLTYIAHGLHVMIATAFLAVGL